MDRYDIVSIGDITTDTFIKLKIANVLYDANGNKSMIQMPFANKIPFENSVIVPAVGNSANAAVCSARLGLKTALVSNVGNDLYGEEDISVLKAENVGTEYIRMHPGKKSNHHYVLLFEDERTILIKHEEYAYGLPEFTPPRFIYLSSLSENSLAFHNEIADYLEKNPDIKLAFQPGTFQIELGYEKLKRLYKACEIFFCNVEEAEKIVAIKSKDADRKEQVKKLLREMYGLGPKKVVITDGPKGAYGFDGTDFVYIKAYPDKAKPVDRTGAGDSFSATVVAALALDLPFKSALEWGPVNSMSVVQYIGAREGLLKKAEIERLLAERPVDYKTELI